MPASKTERLVNLVICLLASRTFITKERLRTTLEPYRNCPTDEAFERMFERDKEELRELGIPLETGKSSVFDDEIGYRIRRQDYELPEIQLAADEAAVLGIASRVLQSAELAGAAAGAMLKLKAASRDVDGEDDGARLNRSIEPRLTTQEPSFGPLWEAVRDRRPVTFSYLASGRSDASKRELEPWGVVNRRGRWYVAGHDRGRGATRVFRMSRITGPVKLAGPPGSVKVPDGTDVRELVQGWDRTPPRDRTAVLRIRKDAGVVLRRWAREITPETGAAAGWDRVTLSFADAGWYAEYLASFGPDIMVLDPPDLREAVITRLKGVLA
jgi:proteasome accessory factor B